MPRLAANLSTLFTELEFPARFGAARAAGFRFVEYQFPYAYRPEALAAWAGEAGVQVVLHNLPAGDMARGERGIACLPGREHEFRDALEQAIVYAKAVNCPRLNCLAGLAPPDREHFDVLAGNVRHAARRLGEVGIELVLEAINTRTVPGFFLSRSAQAIDVLNAAGEANARLQYDLFHMQIMEGDLACTLERLLGRIGHIQIADVPGRHEPGSGEINFAFLFAHLDRLGYSGWVGCEYNPSGDTLKTLTWAKPYLSP
jgi:hydroxypyruvate isomerase